MDSKRNEDSDFENTPKRKRKANDNSDLDLMAKIDEISDFISMADPNVERISAFKTN